MLNESETPFQQYYIQLSTTDNTALQVILDFIISIYIFILWFPLYPYPLENKVRISVPIPQASRFLHKAQQVSII